MNHDIGAQVQVRAWRGTPKLLHWQFGEVIGVIGEEHCPGVAMYTVELFYGAFVRICHCSVVLAPPPATPVRWRDCVWAPACA